MFAIIGGEVNCHKIMLRWRFTYLATTLLALSSIFLDRLF